MTWIYMLAAVGVSFFLPFQIGANARMGRAVDDASPNLLFGALVNFVIGGLALGVVALATGTPIPSTARLAQVPWWSWTAGLIGASFVGMTVPLGPRLGASLLLASVVVGQMVGSVIVDHFGLVGVEKHPISLGRIAGVLLLIAGVIVIKKF